MAHQAGGKREKDEVGKNEKRGKNKESGYSEKVERKLPRRECTLQEVVWSLWWVRRYLGKARMDLDYLRKGAPSYPIPNGSFHWIFVKFPPKATRQQGRAWVRWTGGRLPPVDSMVTSPFIFSFGHWALIQIPHCE